MKTTDRTERNMGLKGSITKFRWIGIAIALIIVPVTGVAIPGHFSHNTVAIILISGTPT